MGKKRIRVSVQRAQAPAARATARQATPAPQPRGVGGMAGLLLQLQRTAGNQAVGQLLRREGLLGQPQRPHATARPAGMVQRNGQDFLTKVSMIVSTDTHMSNRVWNESRDRDLDSRQGNNRLNRWLPEVQEALEEEKKGKSLKEALQSRNVPRRFWPNRITPSEKAVRANKEQFLEENVQEEAQKQRKINDIHAIRERKAELGRQVAEAKTPGKRKVLKAQLKALEDIGVDDAAKLDPAELDEKLRQAELEATLEWLKERKKGKLTDDEKASYAKSKGLAKGELKAIKERGEQKEAFSAKLKAVYKKNQDPGLGELIAALKGGRKPDDPEDLQAMIAAGVKALKGDDETEQTLLRLVGMQGANSERWKKKIVDPNAEKVGTVMDVVSGLGKGDRYVGGYGAKYIGGWAGNKDVSGTSTGPKYTDLLSPGKVKQEEGQHKTITQVGTAQQAGDIGGSLADLASLIGELAGASSIATAMEKGDPAEQENAKQEAIDLGFKISSVLGRLGTDATKLAGDWGGATMATQLGLEVLPGFSIATASVALIQHGKDLGMAADRLKGQGSRIEEAMSEGLSHIGHAIGQFKKQNVKLVATGGVNMVADVLKIAGAAITLSGVGVVIGAPLQTLGSVVSALNSAGAAVHTSYKGGRSMLAQAMDVGGKVGAARELLKHNPKHAIQTLIREARGGDGKSKELAMKELSGLGVTEEMLKGSSDKGLRKMALNKMKLKEDPKNLGQTIKEGVQGLKDWAHKDTEFQLDVLLEAKNKLNYGGRSDRGFNWKNKMRLGDVETSTASIHKILKNLSDEERKKLKLSKADRERLLRDTRPQYEREHDTSGDTRKISGPEIDPRSVQKIIDSAGERKDQLTAELKKTKSAVKLRPSTEGQEQIANLKKQIKGVEDFIDKQRQLKQQRLGEVLQSKQQDLDVLLALKKLTTQQKQDRAKLRKEIEALKSA